MPNPLEPRIKRIQKKIAVPQTGIYDLPTCNELEKTLGLLVSDPNLFDKKKNIQKKLGFTGRDVDGIFGVNTTTKIEMFLDERLPDLPVGANMIVSKKSLDLVVESEISSRAAYNSRYKFPIRPGGASGITIGIGYDLGYVSAAEFERDWKNKISDSKYNKLKTVLGKTGDAAQNALTSSIKAVEVPFEAALEVFYTISVPVYAKQTSKIYPGIELLPPDAQGALLSLVYNRGASLDGDRRIEMKNIANWVLKNNTKKIAEELRSMKRLWINDPAVRGVALRREKEAQLVEKSGYFVRPQDYIFA